MDGANSLWANDSDLYVGDFGNGDLSIRNGGQVSNINSFLGFESGSTGTATVTGADSLWANSGDLRVGFVGNGTLNIQNGGQVSDAVGDLGVYSTGTLNILNGGQVSAINGGLGGDTSGRAAAPRWTARTRYGPTATIFMSAFPAAVL